jgi:putative DNA-invertase from lambdoid prophage Rac
MRGIDVILCDMGSTPVTDNGAAKLFFTMLAGVAEFERTRIRERTDEGRAAKKARSNHISGPAPFGWRLVGEKKTSHLEPDADQQAIIGRMRTLRQQGLSLRAVAAALKAEGVRVTHEGVRKALSAA